MYKELLDENEYTQGAKVGDQIIMRVGTNKYKLPEGWLYRKVEDIITGFEYPNFISKKSPHGFHYSYFVKVLNHAKNNPLLTPKTTS